MATSIIVLLIIALLLACLFEFVNGFHDTANAVATVIYTHTLKPTTAVVYSGLWNFAGVLFGGVAVAMGIMNLLPLEVLLDNTISTGMSIILAILISAIIWNLGTWYFGIPASSSHTLIGAILGIGFGFYFFPEFLKTDQPINWGKAQDIGLSLLISPILGFSMAIFVIYIFKRFVKNEIIYKEPVPGKKPPIWIRMILVVTCTLVSFSHGQNDGQKGIGLVMLILVTLMPFQFSLDPSINPQKVILLSSEIRAVIDKTDISSIDAKEKTFYDEAVSNLNNIEQKIAGKTTVNDISPQDRFEVRKSIIKSQKYLEKLLKSKNIAISTNNKKKIESNKAEMKNFVEYVPKWVILMISLSLGLGTMIGWKRIVKTIGEKIGKQHMSYAQGASAEITAAILINSASQLGLPVSTTHSLSSAIAGTMVAKKGLKNLHKKTVRNILWAWILTLPVTIVLSALLFILFKTIF